MALMLLDELKQDQKSPTIPEVTGVLPATFPPCKVDHAAWSCRFLHSSGNSGEQAICLPQKPHDGATESLGTGNPWENMLS